MSELGDVITEKVNIGFKALEASLMERVAKEHKAELARYYCHVFSILLSFRIPAKMLIDFHDNYLH